MFKQSNAKMNNEKKVKHYFKYFDASFLGKPLRLNEYEYYKQQQQIHSHSHPYETK